MQTLLYFIASLAAAAALTAFAVLIQPDSPVWRWALSGGTAVFAASAFVLFVNFMRPDANVIVLASMGGGFALLVGCSVALFSGEPKAITNKKISLLIECNNGLPHIVPPSGQIVLMAVYPPMSGGAIPLGLGGRSGQPGKPWDWAGGGMLNGAECRVTNYGSEAIFDVQMTFSIKFSRLLKTPDHPESSHSKPEFASQDRVVRITKIDAGKDNPFVFYAQNGSTDAIATVYIPGAATFVRSGEAERESAIMLPPNVGGFVLWPRELAVRAPAPPALIEKTPPPVLEDSAASRGEFIGQLTILYMRDHDGISSEMVAGLELPPEAWLNKQLEKRGKSWRIRNIHGTTFDSYNVKSP
jgi:hypothetical protein